MVLALFLLYLLPHLRLIATSIPLYLSCCVPCVCPGVVHKQSLYYSFVTLFAQYTLCTTQCITDKPTIFPEQYERNTYIKALQKSIPQSNHFHQITYTHNRTPQNDTVLPTSLRHASPWIHSSPYSRSYTQSDSPNISTPSRTAPANRSRGSRAT